MIDILISLLIAGIAGGIAKYLVGFDRGGCIISIIVGFIGAMIGSWLARELDLPDLIIFTIRGTEYHILWTIIGAVIFTVILSIISPGKKK